MTLLDGTTQPTNAEIVELLRKKAPHLPHQDQQDEFSRPFAQLPMP